jgi:bacillithiol system protein YtxJ
VHRHLTTIAHESDVDALLDESRERPVLVFKHSDTCGVSAEALEELVFHLEEEIADARYAIVTVQTHRGASNAIAARLGVRHHTPQAILVRDGRAVWSATHFRISAAEITKALAHARAVAADTHNGGPDTRNGGPSGPPGHP